MESVKCYSVVHSAVQSYARHDLSTATATSTVAITSWLSLPGYHYLAITTTDGWANKRMTESKLFFHLMNRVGSLRSGHKLTTVTTTRATQPPPPTCSPAFTSLPFHPPPPPLSSSRLPLFHLPLCTGEDFLQVGENAIAR